MFKLFRKKKKKVALVLGSGGPRGLAHIGVIKILEKYNIPIDLIVGCSAGALVGGVYAFNKDIGKIEDIVNRTNYRTLLKAFIDPSWGIGLIKGDEISTFLKNSFDFVDQDIRDSKILFQAVSTDLETGNEVVFKQGKLIDVIRASISVPILFEPQSFSGRRLIDGAVSNPLPTNIAKCFGANLIIAVNLNNSSSFNGISGKRLKTIRYGQQALDLLTYNLAKEKAKYADIIIEPEVANINWLSLTNGRGVIKKGEVAAFKQIDKIKELL